MTSRVAAPLTRKAIINAMDMVVIVWNQGTLRTRQFPPRQRRNPPCSKKNSTLSN